MLDLISNSLLILAGVAMLVPILTYGAVIFQGRSFIPPLILGLVLMFSGLMINSDLSRFVVRADFILFLITILFEIVRMFMKLVASGKFIELPGFMTDDTEK